MPFQVPGSAVSVSPSSGVPETAGAAVLAGGSASAAAVGAEPLCALPPALVAVTTTRTTWSMSPGDERVGRVVAPRMSAQFVPSASQRCHW